MLQRGGSELGLISNGYGSWCFPGGWIEHGEQAHDTAIRECEEETGVLVRPIKDDGFTVNQSPSGFTVVTLFVKCEYLSGEPTNREPNKSLITRWVPEDLMEELHLFFPTDSWWRRPRDN